MTPRAVVFDIGNVLLGWNPEDYYDRRIGEAARKRMFAETGIHAVNIAIDAGAPGRETVYALADRHPEWTAEVRLWHDDIVAMLYPVIDRSVRLLRALKRRGVPVLALSNFGSESFEIAAASFDFLNEFDRAWVSGRMGVVKPDPRIYEILEAESGFAPEALLFADDRAENIAAAAARGWATHHFTGPDAFAERLVASGLLTGAEAA